MKALFLSFFVSVCLVWGSALAAKTQVDVANLPAHYESDTIQDWIDLLEEQGHLVNVPSDVVALWRGRLSDIIRSRDITNAITAYNTVEAKSFTEIKQEFRLRGGPLPVVEYYQIILEMYRTYEQYGESFWLTDLENYKQRLAHLDTLTDEQWGYLGPSENSEFHRSQCRLRTGGIQGNGVLVCSHGRSSDSGSGLRQILRFSAILLRILGQFFS